MSRPKGFRHTEETKRKMREHHVGFHRPHTDEEKAKLSATWKKKGGAPKSMLGKCHSEETKARMSAMRRGRNNANWKGGITAITRGIRHSSQYVHWRRQVIERDKLCRDCGAEENLDAHHIHQVLDRPDLIFDIANGLTLCEKCHKRHTFWQKLNPRKRGKRIAA